MKAKKSFTFFAGSQKRSGKFLDYEDTHCGATVENPVIPRPYQSKFLRKHANTRLLVVGMPTGSGKSKLMKFAAIARMVNSISEKTIIAVPKTVIKKSFGKEWIKFKGTHLWDIGYNFCDPTVAKVNKLVQFIKNPQIGPSNNVVICSHAALVKAYRKLSGNNEMSYFKDTHIIIDEFHHVMYTENNNSAAICNQLGEFVSELLGLNDESIRLWGLTATFFRGDRQSVLAPSVMNQFEIND